MGHAIISYAILKVHYESVPVYFGYYAPGNVRKERLQLYRTGRTNANDGGVDFVMRPAGRFFQVTESGDYDKYLLDMDKIQHFPVTFVVKTRKTQDTVRQELEEYILWRVGKNPSLYERYCEAIEEIITVNELLFYLDEMGEEEIDRALRLIDIHYRLEMNIDGPIP